MIGWLARFGTAWAWRAALLVLGIHLETVFAGTVEQDRLYGLATCVESLREGTDEQQEALYQNLRHWFETDFRAEEAAFVPLGPSSVLGFPLKLVNPAGAMVPGFMLVLEAPFEAVRASVEKREAQPFTDCSRENCPYAPGSPRHDAASCEAQRVQACTRKLRAKHTLMVMRADDRKSGQSMTILACMGDYVP